MLDNHIYGKHNVYNEIFTFTIHNQICHDNEENERLKVKVKYSMYKIIIICHCILSAVSHNLIINFTGLIHAIFGTDDRNYVATEKWAVFQQNI